MLFYTSIFVASLVTFLVVALISRVIVSSSKAALKASGLVRNSDGRIAITANASDNHNNGALAKSVTCPSINPGANNHVTAWRLADTNSAEDKANHGKNAAWPSRAALGAPLDRPTKVKRDPKKVTLGMVSKPFRRKVSSDSQGSDTASKPIKGKVNPDTSTRDTLNTLTRRKGRPVKSNVKNTNKPWGW